MSKALAVELNIPRLVARGDRMRGSVPLSQFRRFGEYLFEPASGELAVELTFAASEQHALGTVSGCVRGEVILECHRCGKSMRHSFDDSFELAFVFSEAQADELDESCEPFVLDESGRIRSVDLIEDELILQLPIAPRHTDPQHCVDESLLANAPQADNERDNEHSKQNPFAALKKLNLN